MRVLLTEMAGALIAVGLISAQAVAADKASSKPRVSSKSNRFEMVQNGKQMSADDFDAWMKSRGIRIAKGPEKQSRPTKKKKR